MDTPNFNELERIGRDEILARQGGITLAVLEREGSDANLLVGGGAAMADRVVGHNTAMVAATYLDGAKREALDRLIWDRYNERRKSAAAARTTVEFSLSTAAPTSFDIPTDTRLATDDGREFVVTASVTFPGGSTGPVIASVRSVVAGLSQQVGSNRIRSILSTITGAPQGLTVNNPLATAGADDEESDELFRERARRFFVTARRGTAAAIEAGAMAVPGVRSARLIETTDPYGRHAGTAELWITDAFTEALVNVSPTPTAYATQSQALAQAVSDALDEVRAAGVYVRVRVARVVMQPIILSLAFEAGVDVDAVALAARGIIVAVVNRMSPGEPLRVALLRSALGLVVGLDASLSNVILPAGDVVAPTLAVIRTSMGLVTAASLAPTFALQANNPDAGR